MKNESYTCINYIKNMKSDKTSYKYNYACGVTNEKVHVKYGRNDGKIYLKMDVPSV